ncbi:hypothetical protein FJ365_00325 [Candidatus Dependentiae bacterium]|nr:hypothetical protein [Candidatus Dependentiae bacterium]
MCCRLFIAWLLSFFCSGLHTLSAALPCASPASVAALSLDLPRLPELEKCLSVIVLDNPVFFNKPLRCHLVKHIQVRRYQQAPATVALDIHAQKYISAALKAVFADSGQLSDLLAYLQDHEGLFVALAMPLVATAVHFFDRYDELALSFSCLARTIKSLPPTVFNLLENGVRYELAKYPQHQPVMGLLGLDVRLSGRQIADKEDMMALFAAEEADVASSTMALVVHEERAYAFFKNTIAELPWNSKQFNPHWKVYWSQQGLDIYVYHTFLIRALCEMWLKRKKIQREAWQAQQNKCLKRLCEALNHEAQNLAIDREKRVLLSTESLMRYVDQYLGNHCYKEHFKVFLRMSTYPQDHILPS